MINRFNLLIQFCCSILDIDQADGAVTEVVLELGCSELFGYSFRSVRADTALDFKPITIFTNIPENGAVIKENMRLLFEGTDYRIHSVDRWPMGNPQYIELRLQGDGNG